MFNESKSYLVLTTFILMLISTSFAQFTENKIYEQNLANEQSYFTLKDSVNTAAFVYNNKAANKSVKIGLIAGSIGFVAGLATVYLSTMDNSGCDLGCAIAYTVVPIAIGGTGFLVGTTIGYVKNYNQRNSIINYSLLKMPFKQIGLYTALSLPISENYGEGNFKFGISYRNLYKKIYIPNRLSITYSFTERWYYFENSMENYSNIWSEEKLIGLETVHINYNNMFSYVYGFEIGMCFSKAYKVEYGDDNGDIIPHKNISTPYFDLVLGLNINLFSFLSWDITYKYEPYGLYNKIKLDRAKYLSQTHKIETSLSIYLK